ncbi:uncharacterized protein GIQ15_02404 [Arthroderma uncinatum]|uniref:uncharacterized protein n=1 Tax=Arthroderma uncinatum TaxID=74035 RepID=UPI00144A8E79|nr:uncharacterized protein GIQ15_02404 [Arthroderma uncinatum]KAF3483080.1 hypothetical protein GIQ15_02404 [Arthroderma uncinatum]
MRHAHAHTHSVPETTAPRKRKPKVAAGTSQSEGDSITTAAMRSGNEGRQEFFFVDDKSSKKGKRSHVMKHHVREKRKGSHGQLSISNEQHPLNPINQAGGRQANIPTSTSITTSASTAPSNTNSARILLWLNGREEKVEGEREEDQSASTLALAYGRSGSGSSTPTPIHTLPARHHRPMDLRVQPGAGTLDPFDTLPLQLTPEAQKLADIWTTKLAYWSGQNPHLKTSVFQSAMRDMATFHVVILTYGARFEACASGNKERGTETSRAYVAAAQKLLEDELHEEKRMEGDNDWDDGGKIVMALASLSVQEDRFGITDRGKPYLEEALDRLRKGPRKGARRRRQRDWGTEDTYTHYIRLTLAPGGGIALTPADGERLVAFVHDAEAIRTSLSSLSSPSSSSSKKRGGGSYLDAFRFHSPLHLLLAAGPIPTHVPPHERRWVIQSTSVGHQCRTAALIYIVAALLDLNDEDRRTRFMDGLMGKVVRHRLDREPSTETLLWVLLEDDWEKDLRNSHRTWFVGDLMTATKGMGESLQFLFGEVLLRSLMGREADLEISAERFEREARMVIAMTADGDDPGRRMHALEM